MPLERVELPGQRSRAFELYTWLRGEIVSGNLRPHERLVETAIAEIASVSRTPVREALQRLKVDGLVREADGGGAEVCGFSLAELADLCAVRETLEGMATGLAAMARSDMEISALRNIVVAERAAIADEGASASRDAVTRQIELNHSFHETLWRASRNRYLADELDRLRQLIERLQETTLRDPVRLEEAVREHAAIVDALERRDSTTAEHLARVHFRNAMDTRLSMSRPQGDELAEALA